jgi:hypothetical protein
MRRQGPRGLHRRVILQDELARDRPGSGGMVWLHHGRYASRPEVSHLQHSKRWLKLGQRLCGGLLCEGNGCRRAVNRGSGAAGHHARHMSMYWRRALQWSRLASARVDVASKLKTLIVPAFEAVMSAAMMLAA